MDLQLDTDRDLVFEDGDLATVDGLDELKQRMMIALQTGLGEWAWDTSAGLAYMAIRNASASRGEALAAAEVRRVLLAIDGIQSIQEVSVSRDTGSRHLTVRALVRTVYGTTEVTA